MAGPRPHAAERRVVLARVGAPHGVRGEVRLVAFTEAPEGLAAYGPLATGDGRRLVVERLRRAGAGLIAKLQGIDDRDAAAALTGAELTVPRDRLPEPQDPEEFYHADLIGLEAVAVGGAPLGRVAAVHDFGAGAILDIAPGGGRASLMVPFTRQAVPTVDLAAGRIVVDPPVETEASGKDEEAGR